MKKPLAVILLIIGGAVAWFALLTGSYLLAAVSDRGGSASLVVIPILILAAATFGFDCLRRLYRRKFGLNAPLFFLCAFIFPAAWAAYSLPETFRKRGFSYGGSDSSFYLGGLTEYYEQVFTPVAAITILAGALIWFGISALTEWVNEKR